VAENEGQIEILMRSTDENLETHATRPLARWLIHAAKRGTVMTYREAKYRLEVEEGFDTIFSPRMGVPTGKLMDRILQVEPGCPPLNILLVRQGDRLPGAGVGTYVADYLRDDRFRDPKFRETNIEEWREACERIAPDIYAFKGWNGVYRLAFEENLPDFVPPRSREEDGISQNRTGEGPRHKSLRLWVKDNPGAIRNSYRDFQTQTEVVLDSADRVDVVYRGPNSTVAIEVKSSDSDDADLRRGVFQCVKYRAVMKAMDLRPDPSITAILVTQVSLPDEVRVLLRRNGIEHFRAPSP